MKVRHVGMRVDKRLVLVGMSVPHPDRQPRMDVGVVPIVVPVAVRVRHCFVRVLVLVASGEHEIESRRDAGRGQELPGLDVLVKNRPGQEHTQEW